MVETKNIDDSDKSSIVRPLDLTIQYNSYLTILLISNGKIYCLVINCRYLAHWSAWYKFLRNDQSIGFLTDIISIASCKRQTAS